jgi:alpha-N-arabinofuranosidase
MAHEEAWQWAPDMIWFNNLEAYGSANYQVQKLFATNKGTDLLNITNNGKPLTGQNNLYASAVKDINTKEVIVKLVNTSATAQEVMVDLKGGKLASKGSVITLASPNLTDENTFAAPKKIIPTESDYKIKGDKAPMNLPPYSVVVLKLKMK